MGSAAGKKSPAAAAGRRLVFVVGMHRSGTSALTRTLNLLGFRTPDALLAPDDWNASGYWESQSLVLLNERILDALDRVWFDPKPIMLDRLSAQQRQAFVEEASALIRAELPRARSAVLKDPRFCRLAPIWFEAARQAGFEVSALVAVRHPLEVASSLHRRDNMPEPQALALSRSYMIEAENSTRGVPRHLVDFDDLLTDWRKTLRPAVKAAELDGFTSLRKGSRNISAFLDPGARHHDADLIDSPLPEGAEEAISLYQRFRADPALESADYETVREAWLGDWASKSPGPEASSYATAMPEGIVRRSAALNQANDVEGAIGVLQTGVEAFPDIAQLHHRLARMLSNADRLDEALTHQRRAVEIAGQSAAFHHGLSLILARTGELEEAVRMGEKAIELDQRRPGFHNHLGSLYLKTGRAIDAELAFDRAIQKLPDFAQAWHGLSHALQRQQRVPEALKASRRSLELAPRNDLYAQRVAQLEDKASAS